MNIKEMRITCRKRQNLQSGYGFGVVGEPVAYWMLSNDSGHSDESIFMQMKQMEIPIIFDTSLDKTGDEFSIQLYAALLALTGGRASMEIVKDMSMSVAAVSNKPETFLVSVSDENEIVDLCMERYKDNSKSR